MGETANEGTQGGDSQMSAEAVSPISTYFRVCDGVRVRFADNRAESDITVLLLAPWPESLWAFRRIWDRVLAVGRVVAIDLPGFGHSDGRPELIAPDTSGAFLARLIDEWGLGAPHVGLTSAPPRSETNCGETCQWKSPEHDLCLAFDK
jgi:pimeloyl-ACP methyl ester carboxylesterase